MGGANEKAIKTRMAKQKDNGTCNLLVIALTGTCFGWMKAESAHDDKTDGIRNAHGTR